MDDYIRREDAIVLLKKHIADDDVIIQQFICELINSIPAAKVVEARYGRWINIPPYECASGYKKGQECSECHTYYVSDGNVPWSNHKYCAECGAKMDLED